MLLALRSLIGKSPEIQNEFTTSETSMDIILEIALKSFGISSIKNIHLSAVILMCECGYDKYDILMRKKID